MKNKLRLIRILTVNLINSVDRLVEMGAVFTTKKERAILQVLAKNIADATNNLMLLEKELEDERKVRPRQK